MSWWPLCQLSRVLEKPIEFPLHWFGKSENSERCSWHFADVYHQNFPYSKVQKLLGILMLHLNQPCHQEWHQMAACLPLLLIWLILLVFFTFSAKSSFIPLTNLFVTKLRYFSLPILSAFNTFSIISFGSSRPVVMSLAFTYANGSHSLNPQLLFKSLHIWHMQFPGTGGAFFMTRISLQFNFLDKYTL